MRFDLQLDDHDVERIAAAVVQKLAALRGPLSMNEASQTLGISTRTLYRMASTGKLRLAKLGARSVVPYSEINRLAGEREP